MTYKADRKLHISANALVKRNRQSALIYYQEHAFFVAISSITNMFMHLNIAVDWFNAPQDDTATDDRSRQQDSAVSLAVFSANQWYNC